MFFDKIRNSDYGIILYGLTPPKATNDPDTLAGIAEKHYERISKLPIDGVVFYDIQDESLRTANTRPFPFLPTLDPFHYCETYLNNIKLPKIIYQCVGKYTNDSFTNRLKQISSEKYSTVFVGAASQRQGNNLKLSEAYTLHVKSMSQILLGGIAIPERHHQKNDEHLRIHSKIENGCRFFISQAVYDVQGCKNMLSDYYYHLLNCSMPLHPIIITLTPCGSLKTLKFMEWLGIHIPGWLKNELIHSGDILHESLKLCKEIAYDLHEFCNKKKIPLGFNIESLSIRREEIEASIELLYSINTLLSSNV